LLLPKPAIFLPFYLLIFSFFQVSCEEIFTTEGAARHSRNEISEYLPQRRKGRKGRRLRVNIIRKISIFLF
jgi:hypothetical protein